MALVEPVWPRIVSHGFQMLYAGDELVASVEDAECPEVVRSEESAAVGLRNLVTQWHLVQKGAYLLALTTSMSCIVSGTSAAAHEHVSFSPVNRVALQLSSSSSTSHIWTGRPAHMQHGHAVDYTQPNTNALQAGYAASFRSFGPWHTIWFAADILYWANLCIIVKVP